MIINMYTANNFQEGDVGMYIVTIYLTYNKTYSMYRCPHPSTPNQSAYTSDEGIPQGDKITGTPEQMEALCLMLFPSVVRAGYKPYL